MKSKLILSTFSLAASIYLSAGQSGFLYQGKEYIVFKDGDKVGKDFNELFGKNEKRKPGAIRNNVTEAALSDVMYYEDQETPHGTVRCYTFGRSSISCLWFAGSKAKVEKE